MASIGLGLLFGLSGSRIIPEELAIGEVVGGVKKRAATASGDVLDCSVLREPAVMVAVARQHQLEFVAHERASFGHGDSREAFKIGKGRESIFGGPGIGVRPA